jgi:hypothetical protein
VGTAATKAAFDQCCAISPLTVSPLSLKHLARQKSAWHGALVSQQAQSFEVCFALLGQSGMSAMLAACACVSAAMAAPIGASVTPAAISSASKNRCAAKATSGATIVETGLTGQVRHCLRGFNFAFPGSPSVKGRSPLLPAQGPH